MGCDIHSHAERRGADGTWKLVQGVHPFSDRSYEIFGFLAGVRNYSAVTPIVQPRGFPKDACTQVVREFKSWEGDAHTPSWITLQELLGYDYEQTMEDRRCTRQLGPNHFTGAATCAPGEGEKQTVRQFLGPAFFQDLAKLQSAGADRIVFWFDN